MGATTSIRTMVLLFPLLTSFLATSVLANPIADPRPIGISPGLPILPPLPDEDACRKAISDPAQDTAMYFTGLGDGKKASNDAKRYAESKGLTHVSACYKDGFTDPKRYLNGNDADAARAFMKAFSKVYGEKTTGKAYLMIEDGKTPDPASIFQDVEFQAMKDSGKVEVIYRFPPGADDPRASTNEYWRRPADAVQYNKGTCRVHITQYQIPKGDTKYYLEGYLNDSIDNRIGNLAKTDATDPVDITSALPWVLIVTADRPGSAQDVDSKPLHFKYADLDWSSDDDRCKVGAYDSGNRDMDCTFPC